MSTTFAVSILTACLYTTLFHILGDLPNMQLSPENLASKTTRAQQVLKYPTVKVDSSVKYNIIKCCYVSRLPLKQRRWDVQPADTAHYVKLRQQLYL